MITFVLVTVLCRSTSMAGISAGQFYESVLWELS